ncbi:MAG: hypothetical protein JNM75_08865 [Rhodospirillales bacterium]|nr:hypothetical protein [Rhodospirillales bacterium]
MSESNTRHDEQAIDPASVSATETFAPQDTQQPAPDHAVRRSLPDRFLDDITGDVRTEALVDAYLDLQAQLAELPLREIPKSPDDYEIEVRTDLFASDAEVNRKLHEAGFDQNQAQLVYDLAASHLLPMVAEVASTYEAEGQIAKLKQDFGGDEQWQEVSRQMQTWGKRHLPAEAFGILATTREGVLAMHKMMAGGEPALLGNAGEDRAAPTEAELKQMMRDPRYWRDQDAALVERVREGFRQIYDN